jgi:hypothetical protein
MPADTIAVTGQPTQLIFKYNEIIPVLVKAIQEQQTLITALQEKLERNNIN